MDAEQTDQSRPWLAVGKEVADVLSRVDAKPFFRIVQAFDDETRCWFFSGQGRSGLAAQMAAMRLMHVGRNVHSVGEVTAPSIRKCDGLVIVSGSGETPVRVSPFSPRSAVAEIRRASIGSTRSSPKNGANRGKGYSVRRGRRGVNSAVACSSNAASFFSTPSSSEIAQRIPDAHQRMLRRHTNLQ